MKTVNIEDARAAFIEMFNLDSKDTLSKYNENTFMIVKTEFMRYEVIEMLQDWFSKYIIDGYGVVIDRMTVLWTAFHFKTLDELSK